MTDVQSTTDIELPAEENGRTGTGSTRRCMLFGAGAVGATAVLSACGTGSTGTGNTNGEDFSNDPAPAGSEGADTGGGSTGSGSSGGGVLAAVADIPEGGGIIEGDLVITQPTAGTFKAFSKVCTHAGCDVNKVDAGVISCPCHNSKFSIDTGEPTGGPASKPLAETKVKVDGDNIVEA
jgi:Rieske Fe-S protein